MSGIAPAIASWFLAEREEQMRVPPDFRDCAVFLGSPTEAGFYALGTAFFASVDVDGFTFCYLISAAHVVWPNRLKSLQFNTIRHNTRKDQ